MTALSLYDANERLIHHLPRSTELQPLITEWTRSIYQMENRKFRQGPLSVSQVAVGNGYVLCLLHCDGHFLCPFYVCWHEGISTAAWEAARGNLTVAVTEYGATLELAWPMGPPPQTPWAATVKLEHLPSESIPFSDDLRAHEIGVAWALIDFFSE